MMEALLTEAIKQVPSLAVLVWVVMRFLAHIKDSDNARTTGDERRNESMKAISDSFKVAQHEMSTRMTTTIDANTALLAKATVALNRVEDILEAKAE